MASELKFWDALNLSWRDIIQHKGRSAIIVLTISVLFGILMGGELCLARVGGECAQCISDED